MSLEIREVNIIEQMVNKARNKFVLKIMDNDIIFYGTSLPSFNTIKNISITRVLDILDLMTKYGFIWFQLRKNGENVFEYIYISNDTIDFNDYVRTLILLLYFAKYVKSDKEFNQFTETILKLNYIETMFWYSKLIKSSNPQKIIKSFEKLYL